MTLELSEDLLTGVKGIDNQHKELFNSVNKLYEACLQQKGKVEIIKTMTYLEDYIITHFDAEESLMIDTGYSNYTEHRAAHIGFIDTYKQLAKRYKDDGANSQFVLEINKFLKNWLLSHLNNDDKKLAKYLIKTLN